MGEIRSITFRFNMSIFTSFRFSPPLRLRFPSDNSIASVIRSRYNDEIVKQIRRFEKLDFKIRKNEVDLDIFIKLQ